MSEDLGMSLHDEDVNKVETIMNKVSARVEEILISGREVPPGSHEGPMSSKVSRKSKISARSEICARKAILNPKDKRKAWKNDAISLNSEPCKFRSGKFNIDEVGRYSYNGKKQLQVGEGAVMEMKDELSGELAETCTVLRKEVGIVKELIEQKDAQGLLRKVGNLEQLQAERDKPVYLLYRLLSDNGAMQLAEKVTSQDEEIRMVKELVENVFYEQHEEMVREPQKSHTSRMKKSGASICSSRESLTNSSVASLRTNKFRKNRENCIKKLKFQPSFLREKFSDRQEIFDIQKRLCKGLINGKDQITSGDEIQKLEESYQTMVSAAVRLREHLPSEEANDIDIHVEQEESEVFEVKKQMVKLMTRKSQAGEDEIVEGNTSEKQGIQGRE